MFSTTRCVCTGLVVKGSRYALFPPPSHKLCPGAVAGVASGHPGRGHPGRGHGPLRGRGRGEARRHACGDPPHARKGDRPEKTLNKNANKNLNHSHGTTCDAPCIAFMTPQHSKCIPRSATLVEAR